MEKKIITVPKSDVTLENEAFAQLMHKTELSMNQLAHSNPLYYKGMSPSRLEEESCLAIQHACDGTPFNPEKVILVSGHSFPDIIAGGYYGIEVKSTKSDHWTSTGSSIVESTRSDLVKNIYMLFGKLGGERPEFRCRPYCDVLSEIAVTHSPRYLIDMRLKEGETIFDKMDTTYDEFRTNENNISKVRSYYRGKAKNGQEMPWWISSDDIDRPINFNLRLWNSLDADERKKLIAYCLILFPDTWHPNANPKTKYNQASLWLCSFAQVLFPNIRDAFTAGGKIAFENGKRLPKRYPQVYKSIIDLLPQIKEILECPSSETFELIQEFNPKLLDGKDLYQTWSKILCTSTECIGLPMRRWLEEQPKLEC